MKIQSFLAISIFCANSFASPEYCNRNVEYLEDQLNIAVIRAENLCDDSICEASSNQWSHYYDDTKKIKARCNHSILTDCTAVVHGECKFFKENGELSYNAFYVNGEPVKRHLEKMMDNQKKALSKQYNAPLTFVPLNTNNPYIFLKTATLKNVLYDWEKIKYLIGAIICWTMFVVSTIAFAYCMREACVDILAEDNSRSEHYRNIGVIVPVYFGFLVLSILVYYAWLPILIVAGAIVIFWFSVMIKANKVRFWNILKGK